MNKRNFLFVFSLGFFVVQEVWSAEGAPIDSELSDDRVPLDVVVEGMHQTCAEKSINLCPRSETDTDNEKLWRLVENPKNFQLVKQLIADGADVNFIYPEEKGIPSTVLSNADPFYIEFLLGNGADATQPAYFLWEEDMIKRPRSHLTNLLIRGARRAAFFPGGHEEEILENYAKGAALLVSKGGIRLDQELDEALNASDCTCSKKMEKIMSTKLIPALKSKLGSLG